MEFFGGTIFNINSSFTLEMYLVTKVITIYLDQVIHNELNALENNKQKTTELENIFWK